MRLRRDAGCGVPMNENMFMQHDSLLKVAKGSFKNRRQLGYTDVSQEGPPSQEGFNTAPSGHTGPLFFQPLRHTVPAVVAPPPPSAAAAPSAVPATRSRQKDPPAAPPAAVDTRGMSGDEGVPDVSHPGAEPLSLQQQSVVPGAPSAVHVAREAAPASKAPRATRRTLGEALN